jgi:hypothetical protein
MGTKMKMANYWTALSEITSGPENRGNIFVKDEKELRGG